MGEVRFKELKSKINQLIKLHTQLPTKQLENEEDQERYVDDNLHSICALRSEIKSVLAKMNRTDLTILYHDLLEENSRICGELIVDFKKIVDKHNKPNYVYDHNKRYVATETRAAKGEVLATQVLPLVRNARYYTFNAVDFAKLSMKEMLEEEYEMKALLAREHSSKKRLYYRAIVKKMQDICRRKYLSLSEAGRASLAAEIQDSAQKYSLESKKHTTFIRKSDEISDYLKENDESIIPTAKSMPIGTHRICRGIDAMMDARRINAEVQVGKYSKEKGLLKLTNTQLLSSELISESM